MLWDVSQAYGQFLCRSGVLNGADARSSRYIANGRFDKQIKKALGGHEPPTCPTTPAPWVSTKAVSN